MDKISVIIPVYNGEKFIKETIKSVLDQTHKNFEIILVNDGSSDSTLSEIQEFVNESNFTLINTKNSGASAAKKLGLVHATGDYIQYLDADDLLSPEKFEVQIKCLKNSPNAVAVCNTAYFYDGENHLNSIQFSGDYFFNDHFCNNPIKFLINLYGGFDLKGGMIQPNAFLVPKKIIESAGTWNTDISPCMDEDGEYFCRVLLNSNKIIFNREVLNYYRKFRFSRSLSSVKSEISLRNLVKSTLLKHEHLLKVNKDPELLKNIDSATYRTLDEIKLMCFNIYPQVFETVTSAQAQLKPHLINRKPILGGTVINLIAKIFGWKVAKRLQLTKLRLLHTLKF
ncbi:glycosyltransferase family A protein [Pedobacter sp. ASV28]|uniref:glycosyltransferase family 2 protein n=1 Tax=Pedobacter sp. ASV28 TaxID=2795123 RepID=UPI0018EA7C81|nr:glycosyltransferase family A protein [Pedobacter sp. ASV28]